MGTARFSATAARCPVPCGDRATAAPPLRSRAAVGDRVGSAGTSAHRHYVGERSLPLVCGVVRSGHKTGYARSGRAEAPLPPEPGQLDPLLRDPASPLRRRTLSGNSPICSPCRPISSPRRAAPACGPRTQWPWWTTRSPTNLHRAPGPAPARRHVRPSQRAGRAIRHRIRAPAVRRRRLRPRVHRARRPRRLAAVKPEAAGRLGGSDRPTPFCTLSVRRPPPSRTPCGTVVLRRSRRCCGRRCDATGSTRHLHRG